MAEAAVAGQLEWVISMVQLPFLQRSPSGRTAEILLGAGQLGVACVPFPLCGAASVAPITLACASPVKVTLMGRRCHREGAMFQVLSSEPHGALGIVAAALPQLQPKWQTCRVTAWCWPAWGCPLTYPLCGLLHWLLLRLLVPLL